MIFPNEIGTKNKRMDNKKVEPDPGSIWSKAKRARLARAEEQQRQAAEEAANSWKTRIKNVNIERNQVSYSSVV